MPKPLSHEAQDDFRERTCAAAARLFRAHGADGVTMRQIAAELGCSPMLPYRYFADRDDILAHVRARAFDAFADALGRAYASRDDVVAKSRALSDAYLDFALDHPGEYGLIFDVTQPDEERYPRLVAATARARALITKRFEDLIAAGVVSGDPQAMGFAFWSAAHGVAVLHLAGKLPPDTSIREFYHMVVATLFRGFRHAKQRAPDGGPIPRERKG